MNKTRTIVVVTVITLGVIGLLIFSQNQGGAPPNCSSSHTNDPSCPYSERIISRIPTSLSPYWSNNARNQLGHKPVKVAKRTMELINEDLDKYLEDHKNNDLKGLSRELLTDLIILVSINHTRLYDIEDVRYISFEFDEFKTIPIEAIHFLYPNLKAIYLKVTEEADLSVLLKLERLEKVIITGSEIRKFPHCLSKLPHLTKLFLIDTSLREIIFNPTETEDRKFRQLLELTIRNLPTAKLENVENLHIGMPKLFTAVVPVNERLPFKKAIILSPTEFQRQVGFEDPNKHIRFADDMWVDEKEEMFGRG